MFSTIQHLSMSATSESAAEFSAVGPSTLAHLRYMPAPNTQAIGRLTPGGQHLRELCPAPTTKTNTKRNLQGSRTGSFMLERPVMFDLADPLRM